MTLDAFYFGQPRAFLIPTEHLSEAGVSAEFAARIRERRGLSQAWIDQFNAAFALAFRRVDDLFGRATAHWFPPRLQNVCVATDLEQVHPYQRPLSGSAWLVFAADFEPETSSVEFGAYQFVHNERLNIAPGLPEAILANLSYFLTLSGEQRSEFAAGCARSTRPDAVAYRALGQASAWLDELCHKTLRPPPALALPEPLQELGPSGLLASASQRARLDALINTMLRGVQQTVDAYYAREAACADGLSAGDLLAWIAEHVPQLVLVNGEGQILWDPERPTELDAVRALLGEIRPGPAQCLRDDLAAIDAVTRRFRAAVKRPLPPPSGELDQSGGTYLHTARGLMAFDLTQQPAWVPLRERTPPYQRLLLAARTGHEWGHLADEAKLIAMPDARRADHDALASTLAQALQRAYDRTPPALQDYTLRELKDLGRSEPTPGAALAAFGLSRMPDLLANRISQRLVSVEELEAYLRVNVRTHREERLGPFRLLANFLVEYQYICLSPIEDPLSYFLELTGAKRLFVGNGLLSEAEMRELFGLVAQACALHEIDAAGLSL